MITFYDLRLSICCSKSDPVFYPQPSHSTYLQGFYCIAVVAI